MPPSAADDTGKSSRNWRSWIGLLWLVVFCLWFYSFQLPNGRTATGETISRGDVWSGMTDILLENIFPTPSVTAPPSGWQYLPQRFDILGVAAFILAGAWALGTLILRALSPRDRFDGPTRLTFAFGLGLSGLSLLTLFCGLMEMLSRTLLGGVIAASLVIAAIQELRDNSTTEDRQGAPWSKRRWDTVPILCLVVIAPFLLAMLLGAMLPSIDFDVKEYHLEGPKEYFLNGRVGFLSHNVYTSFPFLTEMLSLLGMVLRDDWYRGALIGKTVLMSFAPLTALGLFAAGRRLFNPTVGWLCVLLYLSTPWIYRISVIAYAEGGLTFYLFATLLAVIQKAGGCGQDSAVSPHHSSLITHHSPLLCGLLAGSAVACKYPGVLSVAIPLGGFLLFQAWRQATSPTKRILTTAGWFTLGTLITFGPWMAKNIHETGNPVYPLLYSVFGGTDWSPAAHAKWQNGHPPAIVGLMKQPAELPVNLGQRIVDVIAKSDWQSPLLFGAAPLAFLWSTRRRVIGGLWAYIGWLFLTWWALTHQIDRFWIPMLPVVTLLAGAGLGKLIGHQESEAVNGSASPLPLTIATSIVIAATALFNLAFITTRLCGYNAFLIDLDTARKDATTPSIALLENQLPSDAHVLFVGEAQVFDATFDYTYNTVFDESFFELWTAELNPSIPADQQSLLPFEMIQENFEDRGITHVFVNWSEVLRYRQTYGYTDYVSPERFRQLVAADVLSPVTLDPQQTLRLWESLDESTQEEIMTWGPSLKLNVVGLDAFQQFELFEVRRSK